MTLSVTEIDFSFYLLSIEMFVLSTVVYTQNFSKELKMFQTAATS